MLPAAAPKITSQFNMPLFWPPMAHERLYALQGSASRFGSYLQAKFDAICAALHAIKDVLEVTALYAALPSAVHVRPQCVEEAA